MTKIVISSSRGTDDPTMATLPFLAAKVAKEQGNEVTLWLQNEAVIVAKKGVADSIQGTGIPALKDVLQAVIESKTEIWVCTPCAASRKIDENDFVNNASLKGMDDFVKKVLESDKSIDF